MSLFFFDKHTQHNIPTQHAHAQSITLWIKRQNFQNRLPTHLKENAQYIAGKKNRSVVVQNKTYLLPNNAQNGSVYGKFSKAIKNL